MKPVILVVALASAAMAQEPARPAQRPVLKLGDARPVANSRLPDGSYLLAAGTRIPLNVLTSASSKNSQPGDQIYLQTLVPVAVDNRIVIPVGSYVTGTITDSRRPGKVKGRGEIGMRFDALMFPNGTSLKMTGRIGALGGENPGDLKRDEGTVKSEGSVGKDAMVIAGTTAGGAATGRWIGDSGRDGAIGAGSGGLAGLAFVLLTRGPDAVLKKGDTVDMVLTSDLKLTEGELAGKGSQ